MSCYSGNDGNAVNNEEDGNNCAPKPGDDNDGKLANDNMYSLLDN